MRQRREGAVFGGRDPGVEAVAEAAGHHRGEGPDVAGEPVEVGIAVPDGVVSVAARRPGNGRPGGLGRWR